MQTDDKITGIILAGGKSSRMGMDKGLCTLNGKPMVLFSIEILDNICDNIIISSNNSAYEEFGFPVISDEIKNIGPIGGIYSSLKQSKSQHNYFLSCDMPFISIDLVEYVLSFKNDFDAVIPQWNSFPEPMCAYYNKRILKNLENQIQTGNYKLQNFIRSLNYKSLEIGLELPFYNEQLFTNINSQEDLDRITNKFDFRK